MPIKRTVTKTTASKLSQAEMESIETPSRATSGSSRMTPLAIAVVVIVLVAAVALGIKQTWFSEKEVSGSVAQKDAATAPAGDVADLIGRVSKHIVTKSDESPTVATIQDITVLQQQNAAFYKDAQNGDRLLVWSDKAVLYSPTRDMILAVLPISLPASAPAGQQPPAATSQPESAVIEVRNGSGVTGLAKTLADSLKSAGLDVLPAASAGKDDYAKTIIVKLTDKALPQTLKSLESVTNGAAVVAMPEGEKASKADFLVIVGADLNK